jgi:hypothetical protein
MTDYLKNQVKNNLYLQEPKQKDYLGFIINSDDPEFRGRCKIRVFGVFEDIPDADLPFATPHSSLTFSSEAGGAGSFSYPKPGTLVRVRFINDDFYMPEYYIIHNLNENMKAELSADYVNAHVLLYDEDEKIKIFYQKNKGIVIFKDGSIINIDNKNDIHVQHTDGCSTIHMTANGNVTISGADNVFLETPHAQVGKTGSHPITKWDMLYKLLMQFATQLDTKIPVVPCNVAMLNAMAANIGSSQGYVGD